MEGTKNPNYRHGGYLDNKPEYNSWRAMRERCNKPRYRRYDLYGGRGIKVCERWDNSQGGFLNFLKDMGKKPTPKHSIDRIDRDKDYTPENCVWATQSEQMSHTSRSVIVTIDGVTDNLTNHARRLGINRYTVQNRIDEGWTYEDAVKTPPNPAGVNFNHHRVAKPKCEVCGTLCRSSQNKFCSTACYLYHRWGFTRS